MSKDKLRLIIFLAVVAFIVGGPFYRHVLGGSSRVFGNWIMVSKDGTGHS